jgi:hypothetical protein
MMTAIAFIAIFGGSALACVAAEGLRSRRNRPPEPEWTVAELREMRRDLIAERSKPSRARKLSSRRAVYERRKRLLAAGFHGVYPGGPKGVLP